MNEIQVFSSADFGEIRTNIINGEPWFVASDVCAALDINNSRQALTRLDEDEKGVILSDTPGGIQQLSAINQAGLYALVLSSRKPEAKAFKRWITHDVVPSIRKYGMYAVDDLLNDPDLAIKAFTALKEERAKNKALAERNAILEPKAEFFDAVADSKTAISMNEVAKVLAIKGYGRNNLFEFLRNAGILDRYNVPYQRYVDSGWFRVIEQKFTKNGEQYVTTKTLVYQKGVDAIRRMLLKQTA